MLEAVAARAKRPSMCPEAQALMDAMTQTGLERFKLNLALAEEDSEEKILAGQDHQRIKALELEVQVLDKRVDEIKQAFVQHVAQHRCYVAPV